MEPQVGTAHPENSGRESKDSYYLEEKLLERQKLDLFHFCLHPVP